MARVLRTKFLILISLAGTFISLTKKSFGHEHVHIKVHLPRIVKGHHHQKKEIIVEAVPVIHKHESVVVHEHDPSDSYGSGGPRSSGHSSREGHGGVSYGSSGASFEGGIVGNSFGQINSFGSAGGPGSSYDRESSPSGGSSGGYGSIGRYGDSYDGNRFGSNFNKRGASSYTGPTSNAFGGVYGSSGYASSGGFRGISGGYSNGASYAPNIFNIDHSSYNAGDSLGGFGTFGNYGYGSPARGFSGLYASNFGSSGSHDYGSSIGDSYSSASPENYSGNKFGGNNRIYPFSRRK